MYEELSKRKIKNCILASQELLNPKQVSDCKDADCSKCCWNKYESKRRKIKQLLNSNAKHWTIRKGLL